jgi:hypothetical protein
VRFATNPKMRFDGRWMSSFMRFDDTEGIATLASAYDSPSNPVAI